MVLSCVEAGAGAGADGEGAVLEELRGVPEAGGALSSYFVLMRQGDAFTALPVEQVFAFRPAVQ